MRSLNKILLLFIFVLFTGFAFGQTDVSGTVKSASDNTGIPGVTVLVKGTTEGTITDMSGNYKITVPKGTNTLTFSYIGYETKEVVVSGSTINVSLNVKSSELDEIVVVGVADIAKDRQTPVASSTMMASEIQERIGTKELPEVLNYTPSIYATKQGGGFGDARINVRGFDSKNTAVMINGMPVNDMESGKVYWSNWAGLADVTSAIQVQRGLGSSKLAISSIGGTINVLTNTSDKKEGGAVAATFGNDLYMKYSAAYNTGLLDNGFSASMLISRFSGNGYVDGTEGQGWTWFISTGYKINKKHNIMFTATGAPQWHNQRYYAPSLSSYIKYGGVDGEPNIKYNSDWGYYNGEVFTMRRNFYHKPIASLNHEWKINNASKLSTVLYGSWGRGGGTGDIGGINGSALYYGQFKDENGLYRFDDMKTWNTGGHVADFGADRAPGDLTNDRHDGASRRASMNSHDWYGVISNYHNNLNENLSFDFGVDLRTYSGYHYRVLNNILGATDYLDNRDRNNPNRTLVPSQFVEATPNWNPFIDIKGQDKIEYYNQGNVRWGGVFGQVEYKTDKYSAFVQAGGSSQQFQRVDYFNLPADVDGDGTDEPQISDWTSMMGGNLKGGFNYNINKQHNIFINSGYYSKQPMFNAVFPNYTNNNTNENLVNEKIFGLEAGYGFITNNYKLKLNLYRTSWKDRFQTIKSYLDINGDGNTVSTIGRVQGIEEIHSGVELEGSARFFGSLKVYGMVSAGDWVYASNVSATFVDDNNDALPQFDQTIYLDGVKVGDAAQFTSRIGANYNVIKGLYVDMNYFYADKLFAKYDATSFSDANGHNEALQLPSFGLLDASLTYKHNLKKGKRITARFTMNNVLDKVYISESATNKFVEDGDETWNGINTSNRVFFGWGRSWNISLKFSF
ncbi:TonB-dependent receptor [Lutibacter sp.]